jgi:OOP family OmpA-OmpF porin
MKTTFVTLLATLLCAVIADAQIIERAKNRTKDKVKDRTEQKTDETIDKGLDKVEEGIGNLFKKKKKKNKDTESKTENKNNNSEQETESTQNDSNDVPEFKEYKGSTFIPGKNILFYENFDSTYIGAGNRNWFVNEIDASEENERPNIRSISQTKGKWLKMPKKGLAFPNSFKNLPEQFTIEFDMYVDPEKMSEMEGGLSTNFVAKSNREEYDFHWSPEPALTIDVHPHGPTKFVNILAITEYSDTKNYEDRILLNETFKNDWKKNEVNRVSIARNGQQVSLYLNGKEMFNLPNALPKKEQYNLILTTNMWGDGIFISNYVVAGNIANAVEEIKTEGKFVTNAIYFDVNSSRIKPISWATINNIAQAIKSTNKNVLIVGHTDSDGDDNLNLKLSQKRAIAVKNTLVKEFGIPESRFITDGKGETEPVENNQTASGKAKNRRVEFILQ